MKTAPLSRALLLVSGALACAPALASSPTPGAPADGPRAQPGEDAAVNRRIDEMNRACASNPMSRVVMPRPRCPKMMEAVVKLGDGAVPALARRVLAWSAQVSEAAAAQEKEKKTPGQPHLPLHLLMDDSPSLMTSVLGRIGTPAAQEALVRILAHPAVQRHDASTCYSVYSALRESRLADQASLGAPNLCQTPAGRAELLQGVRALIPQAGGTPQAAKLPGAS
jgi:hypothetical protein